MSFVANEGRRNEGWGSNIGWQESTHTVLNRVLPCNPPPLHHPPTPLHHYLKYHSHTPLPRRSLTLPPLSHLLSTLSTLSPPPSPLSTPPSPSHQVPQVQCVEMRDIPEPHRGAPPGDEGKEHAHHHHQRPPRSRAAALHDAHYPAFEEGVAGDPGQLPGDDGEGVCTHHSFTPFIHLYCHTYTYVHPLYMYIHPYNTPNTPLNTPLNTL